METKLNEYGDKVGKKEICQGILLILGVIGLLVCATLRGCQEIHKHRAKSAPVPAQMGKIQNSR